MSQSPHFNDYKYDLSLEHDGTNRFMVWIIACLIYIAALALMAALASKAMVDSWQSYATTHVTLEIPYNEDNDDQALLMAEAVTPLAAVEKVEIIPRSETAAMVAESLGQDRSGDAPEAALLPLPMLIDVTLSNASDTAFQALEDKALEINDQARLQRHEDWARDIVEYGETLYTAALVLLLLMGSMTVLTLIWTLTSRINVHQDEIDILAVVGANDAYIARQFQHFALTRTLTGCLIGLALALLTLVIVRYKLPGAAAGLPFSLIEMIGWLSLPLIACLLIAWLTSHITLARNLAKLT
ncbi:MAG: cell division protein FtsX [Pseudomonadota bacterium]